MRPSDPAQPRPNGMVPRAAREDVAGEVPSTPRQGGRHPRADFILVALGVVAVLAVVLPTAFDGYDNDIWFILASGRQVVQEGFPTANPWAVYSGLGIVIQQWMPDVLAYVTYSVAGWYGLTALLLVVCSLLELSLYRLGRTCSPQARPETVIVASALALIGLRSYISYRPQVYTMVFMCLTLQVMERYRRNGSWRGLLWLVPLEVAHANFHASMAPVDIAIVGAYLIPNLRSLWDALKGWLARRTQLLDAEGRPTLDARAVAARTWGLSQASYPRLPLLATMALMALSTLANPYGLDGALYLVRSIGAAGYGNYIEEMKALMPTTADFGIVFLAALALGLVLVGGRGRMRIDLPLSLCVLVLGYLGFQHVRNVWLVVPFVYVLLLKAVRRLPFEPGRYVSLSRGTKMATCALACVVAAVMVWGGVATLSQGSEHDAANTPVLGVDALDGLVPADERSGTGVFCTFEAGGYLEWRGYQVSMDARPELWEPGITGVSEHYYQHYVDMMSGSRSVRGDLEASGCAYAISKRSSVVDDYLESSDSFECIYPGAQYQVWRRR